jgi:single-strand DNA-binding protein
MAGSVNKVILIGNVGRDPEIRSTNDGTRIANFTLATSDNWRDKASGERRERTEWHRIVIFNDRLTDVVEKYVKKGAKLYIEGSLQTRKWTDKEGQERYTTEVVLQRFRGELTMLDSRGGGGGDFAEEEPAAAGGGYGGAGGGRSGDGSRGRTDELDDEIPFVRADEFYIGSKMNKCVF